VGRMNGDRVVTLTRCLMSDISSPNSSAIVDILIHFEQIILNSDYRYSALFL